MTLDRLPIGATAVVGRIGCGRRTGGRLMEMGLLPGTRVEMVQCLHLSAIVARPHMLPPLMIKAVT